MITAINDDEQIRLRFTNTLHHWRNFQNIGNLRHFYDICQSYDKFTITLISNKSHDNIMNSPNIVNITKYITVTSLIYAISQNHQQVCNYTAKTIIRLSKWGVYNFLTKNKPGTSLQRTYEYLKIILRCFTNWIPDNTTAWNIHRNVMQHNQSVSVFTEMPYATVWQCTQRSQIVTALTGHTTDSANN